MGKVMSIIYRKANRFNVENRAHRFLDKEKLPPAPKFESSYEDMKRTLTDDPEFVERASKRDVLLDNRLKQVFVTSEIHKLTQIEEDEKKPLPLNRSAVEDFEFGFKEPVKVTIGRCTLRQAMKFLVDHESDPTVFTAAKIAEDYKIKHDTVEKILKHFRIFQIHIPDKKLQEKILEQKSYKAIESKKDE
ncbi:protein NDUFAF4 homolog [Condylostylus longicornis]|uniref:protein NDUFAF4 homolog n=1 Tax=Condylostylus longicornis TaxID=2530218 RepID=UPI00244E2A49|nr:protein NDUFAF4 homolog [Condylostylus longicornis]